MSTLLHMSEDPRGAGSDSNGLGGTSLSGYRQANLDVTVDHLDGTLPAFGTLATGAKMAMLADGSPGAEQAGEWDQAHEVFECFAEADTDPKAAVDDKATAIQRATAAGRTF